MSVSEIQQQIKQAMKDAMRAKDKPRLSTIRMIMAEFKRIEVDERIELDDARVLTVLDKMSKQRRDSLNQFEQAGREDLATQERLELAVIADYLPTPLSADELSDLIAQTIASTGAESMKDMGKVMAILKPQIQGRADVGAVSGLIKKTLA